MKKTKLVVLALLMTGLSFAQSNKEDVDVVQALFGKDKKELVQQYLTITEGQKEAFWTSYDAYEAERKIYGKERIALIEDYANSYASLDDAKAVKLTTSKLEVYNAYSKIQKNIWRKCVKLLVVKKLLNFFNWKII